MSFIPKDLSVNVPSNECSFPQVYVDEEGLQALLLLHNERKMLEKSNTILDNTYGNPHDNPQNNSNIDASLPSDCASFVDNDICCLCGKSKSYHSNNKPHKFFKIIEEYRCKKCNKFFYQHNHAIMPCFSPIKRIQY